MKFLAIMALVLVSSSAFSLTLAEKKQWASWQTDLTGDSGYASTFKTKCGYDLPVTMEEKFLAPFMEANTSAPAYCDSARSAMSSMCEADKLNKEAITAGVKKVECKLGEKDKVSFNLDKKTKVLTMTVGLGAANLDDEAKKFLDKNL